MRAVPEALARVGSVPLVGALVTVPLAVALLAGPVAAVAVALGVAVGGAVGPGVAIVVAHLVAVAVAPAFGAVDILVFEASLAPLVAAPRVAAVHGRDAAVAWLAAIGVGGVVAVADRSGAADPLVAATLFATAALAVYAIHRFELVVLDLVPDGGPEGER